METRTIPDRKDVPVGDRWNLVRLYPDAERWELGFRTLSGMRLRIVEFRGTLGQSPGRFAAVLEAYRDTGILEERLGYYAHLRVAEDEGESESRARFSRFMTLSSSIQAEWAWLSPEIQSLSDEYLGACMDSPEFGAYRVFLQRLVRFKPHVLGSDEERLLAMQSECNVLPSDAFGVLTNVDIDFGSLETPSGPKPLTQSTFSSFMRNSDRSIRSEAYRRFYSGFDAHRHTLASLLAGSVRLDTYQARVRRFETSRSRALFPDDVPERVYDNLVATVGANLEALHEYYSLRRRALGVDSLRHYDVYVPLVPPARSKYPWVEAVQTVCEALAPLGDDYVATLRAGLEGGWVDRYENRGKRSGAFSAGSYSGDPYILLNYKDDVLRDLFTLAHEAGHSMHSHYSAAANPFLSYNYTIFEAEVASTFNEQLLFDYLYRNADSDQARAALLNSKIDETLGTLFRQTMFAEFELVLHTLQESGEALTVDTIRAEYRKLLVKYFGPEMEFDDVSDLEGLRIPHFYSAFYVYKYATGLSASIALAKRILGGGAAELRSYRAFLASGGSRFPIDALRTAGVDMSSPEPIESACREFAANVRSLAKILGV